MLQYQSMNYQAALPQHSTIKQYYNASLKSMYLLNEFRTKQKKTQQIQNKQSWRLLKKADEV